MIKRLLRDTPMWYLFVCIAVLILVVINFFKLNTGINMAALTILSIANAIRNWKNQRSLAIIFLFIAALCFIVFFKYLYRLYS